MASDEVKTLIKVKAVIAFLGLLTTSNVIQVHSARGVCIHMQYYVYILELANNTQNTQTFFFNIYYGCYVSPGNDVMPFLFYF